MAEYIPAGKIKAERFYINGKKFGKSKIYNNNGSIFISAYYVDNKLEGVYEEYHKNDCELSVDNSNHENLSLTNSLENIREKSNFVNGNEHGKYES
jgi:antitoxin component YwqK of YwqJK toxin-antitoxin module